MYMKCPSCGMIVGNRQIPYETKMKSIDNNPNIDEKDKLEQKNNVIKELKLKRYCCITHIMGFKSMPLIIK